MPLSSNPSIAKHKVAYSRIKGTEAMSLALFPATEDILWPNGIGFSAVPASADVGRQLVELLVERIGRILDDEFGGG